MKEPFHFYSLLVKLKLYFSMGISAETAKQTITDFFYGDREISLKKCSVSTVVALVFYFNTWYNFLLIASWAIVAFCLFIFVKLDKVHEALQKEVVKSTIAMRIYEEHYYEQMRSKMTKKRQEQERPKTYNEEYFQEKKRKNKKKR